MKGCKKMKNFIKEHIYIRSIILVLLVSLLIVTVAFAQASNPLLTNVYTADANPYVYNGRYYIVCGQDQANSTGFNMYAWRLMSSADMDTWTDHGVIARPADYNWMRVIGLGHRRLSTVTVNFTFISPPIGQLEY